MTLKDDRRERGNEISPDSSLGELHGQVSNDMEKLKQA
jgi:hypothetical protein